MKEQKITNKACGLYGLALERISKCEKFKQQVISFPKVFETLCCTYSIKKALAWEILFILRDFGFIEIKPYHGVIILQHG